MAVGRFKRCGEIGSIAVKGHSQSLQPLDAMGCFIYEKTNGIPIAQASACMNGVLCMATGVVFWSRYSSNAPLGPAAGGTTSAETNPFPSISQYKPVIFLLLIDELLKAHAISFSQLFCTVNELFGIG